MGGNLFIPRNIHLSGALRKTSKRVKIYLAVEYRTSEVSIFFSRATFLAPFTTNSVTYEPLRVGGWGYLIERKSFLRYVRIV